LGISIAFAAAGEKDKEEKACPKQDSIHFFYLFGVIQGG